MIWGCEGLGTSGCDPGPAKARDRTCTERRSAGREPRTEFTHQRTEQGDPGEGRPGRFRLGQRGRQRGPVPAGHSPHPRRVPLAGMPSPLTSPVNSLLLLQAQVTVGASSSLRPSRFLPDGITSSFLCFPNLCYSNILL